MPTSTTREEPSKMDFFTKQGGYNLTSIVRKKWIGKLKVRHFLVTAMQGDIQHKLIPSVILREDLFR